MDYLLDTSVARPVFEQDERVVRRLSGLGLADRHLRTSGSMVEMRDELLTAAEAAALLKVSRHTVYRWIAEGRLPAVRYSRRVVRLRRGDLEQSRRSGHARVGEARSVYKAESSVDEEAEQEEVRRLMERYRELSERLRGPDEPPRGSWEALRRHVGVISEEDGEELLRIIMEDRRASRNDPD